MSAPIEDIHIDLAFSHVVDRVEGHISRIGQITGLTVSYPSTMCVTAEMHAPKSSETVHGDFLIRCTEECGSMMDEVLASIRSFGFKDTDLLEYPWLTFEGSFDEGGKLIDDGRWFLGSIGLEPGTSRTVAKGHPWMLKASQFPKPNIITDLVLGNYDKLHGMGVDTLVDVDGRVF